jgi:hypothetical protein
MYAVYFILVNISGEVVFVVEFCLFFCNWDVMSFSDSLSAIFCIVVKFKAVSASHIFGTREIYPSS